MCLILQFQCRELGKSGFPTLPLLDNEELVNACSEIKCATTQSSKCIYITRIITFSCVVSVVLHWIQSRVSSTRTVKCDRQTRHKTKCSTTDRSMSSYLHRFITESMPCVWYLHFKKSRVFLTQTKSTKMCKSRTCLTRTLSTKNARVWF